MSETVEEPVKPRRFFTKSLYRLGIECPTKLFYTRKPDRYTDENVENEFLKALAKGGFQVGALAQAQYPDGKLIETLDYDEALRQTNELLKNDNVTIFEAAVAFENLFVRVDILNKKGNKLELLEVKSSSADPSTFASQIWKVNPLKKSPPVHELKQDWYMEMYDIAFQTFVCRNAFPHFTVAPFLMVADKTKKTTVDGLNQKFRVKNVGGRPLVISRKLSDEEIGESILVKFPVNDIVQVIFDDREKSEKLLDLNFKETIQATAKAFLGDTKIDPRIGGHCKGCEFRNNEDISKSGFHECLIRATPIKKNELLEPLVFDIWNYRGTDKLVEKDVILMRDVEDPDIRPKKPSSGKNGGMSAWERQWLQVEKVKEGDMKEFINFAGLADQMSRWQFPLHFIDFETCMPAIPFNKGRHPYEQIAFQFSHHVVEKDLSILHKGEWICVEPGKFPNFDFVRALKTELQSDEGTIFRYSHHENTVLLQILEQLRRSSEPDKELLIEWIKTITTAKNDDDDVLWEGKRSMVDLLEMEKGYYYHPSTSGSNSIKDVLPAILNESSYLKAKYSKPIYGLHAKIPSRNFDKMVWIEVGSDGLVVDPYQRLPKLFDGYDSRKLDQFLEDNEEIADGGAAMMAYCALQFSEMSPGERDRIRTALLKYCELDTLAMVLIWEHWNQRVREFKSGEVESIA